MGKFCLVDAQRDTKNKYTFKFQSPIGLLSDTQHYGGVYKAKIASELIEEIIGGKIPYTIKQVFSKIKLYGWLPISTRRDNLKQVLFACGGCIQKNSEGNVYITTLNETTPKVIPDSLVFSTGPLKNNNSVNAVSVIEHGFVKDETVKTEELFKGELSGNNFTTPKGLVVKNCAIVTWNDPAFNIAATGSTIQESDANYCVVTAGANVVVSGQKYMHTQNIVNKSKAENSLTVKTAEVKDATLVSLANSASTAERVLAYYGNTITTKPTFILNGEKPTDIITVANSYGEKSTGFIKSIHAQCGINSQRGNCEVVVDYVPPVVVGSRTLVSIDVTTPPTKTNYASGDEFDPTGMIVTAKYDDNSTNVINSYFYSPTGALAESDTQITISYTELGVTKTATTPISVVTLLRFIAVTTPPDQTDYYEDDVFNPQGMVVTAYYSDGSSKVVSNYTYSPTSALTKNDTTITVSYTDTGVTAKAYVDIVVGDAPNLTSIAITTPPTKTVYKIGEYFNTTGMVVTAYFDNDTSKAVSGYTYSPTTALTQDSTTITVSYTRRGITKTATQAITMKYLTKIEITAPPTYTAYYEDNNFNKAGMVVTATYSTGETRNLNEAEYTVSPTTLKVGDTQVTISYTETGITKTATQAITVTYYPYDFTKSAVISENSTVTLESLGASHRNFRIICISGGQGGSGGYNGSSGSQGRQSSSTGGGMNTGSAGSGGQGGRGGQAGQAGKVSTTEGYVSSLTTPISIVVGQGGSGGGTSSAGQNGGETTCSFEGTTATSNNGAIPDSGYEDIFTGVIYASKGQNGLSGANGGNGGEWNQNGQNGGSCNGHSGGSGLQNSTTSGGQYVRNWSFERDSGGSSWGPLQPNQRYNWFTNVNKNTETGICTFSGSVSFYGNNPPSPRDYYHDGYSTHKGYYIDRLLDDYRYAWIPYKAVPNYRSPAWYSGYGGNGGGGASGGYSGNGQSGANGGNTPITTNYGSGGNGGHGGGGGGGGGGTATETTTYKDYNNNSISKTTYPNSAGAGGSGGQGTNGAQGCVIIYFS